MLSVGSRSEATVLARQVGRAASPRRPFPMGSSEICPWQGYLCTRCVPCIALGIFADVRFSWEIGVGTKVKLRPSLRTEQADLPHSALQLVVSLQRRSADASMLVSGSSNGMAPVARAANSLRSTAEGLHTCVALHRFESRGHSRCGFPSCFCSLSPPSYLPWLHGHYPASSATTEALSPSGRGSSGLLPGHERRSFPGS
jgi:hypothetical protein